MLELKELTMAALSNAEREWSAVMGDDLFATEFRDVFAYAERNLGGDVEFSSGDLSAYRHLVDTSTGRSVALVDLIAARQGQQLRLLHIHLGPMIWDYDMGSADASRVRDVMTTILVAVLEDASTSCSLGGVKVYGRSNDVLDILRTIADGWLADHDNAQWSATMQGRWLNFTPTPRK